jgi:hypothetical protein
VLKVLDSLPEEKRDVWWSANKGEANIALGEWELASPRFIPT